MTDLVPAPLTPPDCDLRDFAFMPLDVVRLRDSDMAAVLDAEIFRSAVLSWAVSWHQVPAASLPDDDAAIARLIGMGRDVKGWKKLRAAGALRGFVLCSDGRLYHRVVAEKAVESWEKKCSYAEFLNSQSQKGKMGAAKRWSKPVLTKTTGTCHSTGQENECPENSLKVRDSEGTGKGEVVPIAKAIGRTSADDGGVSSKPEWWPKRDRYGRVVSEITDKIIFDVGKAVLGKSAGGQITKLLKLRPYLHDRRAALELLLRADDTSAPGAWFAKVLRNAEIDEPETPKHVVFPESEYRA